MNSKQQKIHVYAQDPLSPNITIHADFWVYASDLTSDEFRHVLRKLKRGIVASLADIPFTDFGSDNVEVRQVREK